jgi:hypothetical protein
VPSRATKHNRPREGVYCYTAAMSKTNPNIPHTIASEVVAEIGASAEAQGATVREQLEAAYATQAG